VKLFTPGGRFDSLKPIKITMPGEQPDEKNILSAPLHNYLARGLYPGTAEFGRNCHIGC